MEAAIFHRTPVGFEVSAGTDSYLISDNDMPLLKRGYTIPLRDQSRASLGPAGTAYTRRGNVEIRFPSGEVLTLPMRVLQAADNIRRVILTSASPECAA